MTGLRRKLSLALLVLCAVASRVDAQAVTFAWDPSADASGYVVRLGTTPGVYTMNTDAGPATTATISGLTPGTWYSAVVVAYSVDGVFSDPSAAIDFVTPPLACSYALATSALSVSADATSSAVVLTGTPGCAWNPVSHHPFIKFPSLGSGSGSVPIGLVPNYATTPRAGTATIGGQLLTITQDPAAVDATQVGDERARADFNADGFGDLIWQDTAGGYLASWMLAGGHAKWTPVSFPQRVLDPNWRIVGTGDFNGDGKPDLVWRQRQTGALYLWYMNGTSRIGMAAFSFGGEPDTRWKIAGVGDFNGDGKPDLVWQHDTGWLTVYLMNGTTLIGSSDVSPAKVRDTDWRIVGVADLNADHKSDLIFQHSTSGEIAAWMMDGTKRIESVPFVPNVIVDRNWQLAAVLDVNGDQTPDFVWQHATEGGIAVWYMNGTIRSGAATFRWTAGLNWKIAGPK